MRHLSHSLQDHDLIILRVIGEWWDLDLFGEDKKKTVQLLSEALVKLNLERELPLLPVEEAAAMSTLIENGGRMPLAQFSRQFGEIREMGPAALEREEPWFNPQSAAEDLWYRGLIYKGFDETDEGVVEFAYLPIEFQEQFNSPAAVPDKAAGDSPEQSTALPSMDPLPDPELFEAAAATIIDDATTLLILAQNGKLAQSTLDLAVQFTYQKSQMALGFMTQLLEEMNLLRYLKEGGYRPTKAAVGWLKSSPEEAQRQLFSAWQQSDWNALRHMPTLSCEGSGWHNDPIAPRKALLAVLPPQRQWLDVTALVQQVKQTNPDFQRPNGNYDTWYIRDNQTGRFISGFDQWDAVEGQLLHFIVHAPMSWLGMIDHTPTALRLTDAAVRWLKKDKPVDPPAHDSPKPAVIHADGLIQVPVAGDRFQRFQISRFAALQPATPDQPYTYRITPGSLSQARDQGISPARVLQFLSEIASDDLPAGIRRAITRWEENGVEARLEHVVILRVSEPSILEILREHPKTRPYLGEALGDLAVMVQSADWQALHAASAQLGLLLEPVIE